MRYWRESLVIPAAAALLLATNPVVAQSSASSVKQDRQDAAQGYQDLLAAMPSGFALQQAYIGSILALPDVLPPPPAVLSTISSFPPGTAPSQSAPIVVSQPNVVTFSPGGNHGALGQAILQGLSKIEANANSQKPPQNKPAADAKPTAPASVATTIEAMLERLRQQEQTSVLAAALAVREAAMTAMTGPPNFNSAPVGLPAASTSPPANGKAEAMVAALLKRPDVVAAVRDQNVTAALKSWNLAFAAAWPDYAANNSYYPDMGFTGHYTGTALAVMPDGTRSTGSLNMGFDFYSEQISGGMTFASANPNLAGNLTFTNWFNAASATGTLDNNAAAFGGALSDGTWSSDFYGSLGDIVAGNWNATITGGPNAGIVVGKFGGQQ